MKLDRKEILKALETITMEKERIWWKADGYKRSHFGDEVVVDLFCIRRRCTSRKEKKIH
jgi:hypothetical protein